MSDTEVAIDRTIFDAVANIVNRVATGGDASSETRAYFQELVTKLPEIGWCFSLFDALHRYGDEVSVDALDLSGAEMLDAEQLRWRFIYAAVANRVTKALEDAASVQKAQGYGSRPRTTV